MLSKLTIDNYALIDHSLIDFKEGFTVITGETGSGKSIMLSALSLLTGARADTHVMGNKERKTFVEAIFTDPDPNLKSFFNDNNLEWDDKELILRREISTAGKSRGFVNDTPVNLGLLSSVAENLLDIHSQQSNSLLSKGESQLAIIDSYGHTTKDLEKYKVTFKDYVSLRNKIKKIKEIIAQGQENREFILFRLEQLEKIKPRRGELEILEKESEMLGDADRIKSDLNEVNTLLSAGGASALRQLQSASSILDGIDLELFSHDNDENLNERLSSLKIELKDIADTLEDYAERINSDPERYEKVQNRIAMLYESMKRFKVKDEDELVDLYDQLKSELSTIGGDNTDLDSMEHKLKELAKVLKEDAEKLSEKRIEAAKRFASTIEDKIRPLGLPNVRMEVDIEKGKMTSEGQDTVVFKCSFNKNHALQPLADTASGGEKSRVMLGVKSVMAENMKLPTIIFDEIDTGVSGEVAHKMGKMMHGMSQNIQVISVTHLPQVAAGGDAHIKVYKSDNAEKTISHIKILTPEERIEEIAGMLSGTSVNEAAMANARELLNNR